MSTEEVSETIPEEEEHAEPAPEPFSDKGSDNSAPDSPVIESAPLPDQNPVLREVTVSEGE